jgi:uncharacterized membrane protein YoaK (UPF0700 family)
MKKITFFLSIVLLSLAFAMGLIVGRASMPQYDMPEEFNTETISKDTLNPTQLMVLKHEDDQHAFILLVIIILGAILGASL